jgi:hypothetical protein
MSDHLTVSTTERGFDHLPPIQSSYGGDVRVYESSAAGGPHIWLRATDLNLPDGLTVEATLHLTAENAQHLAEQIMFLVKNHYQSE